MKKIDKTREQLLKELEKSNKIIVDLKKSETKNKQTTRLLRESEATTRALLNAPTDVIAIVDTKGIVIIANKAMAKRFGKHMDELVGVSGWGIVPPDLIKSRKKYFDKVIQLGESVRFYDMSHGVWFDNVTYPILDSQGKVTKVALVARDITERKKAEDELKKKMSQMEIFNKAAVGRELRMIELKKEINELLKKAGEPEKYL